MARRKKGLDAEDRALWDRVAATATPLKKPAPRPVDAPMLHRSDRVTPPDPVPVPSFRIGQSATDTRLPHDLSPSVSQSVNAAPLRMDPGTHKRMIKGKLAPEARLDLHGLTLADAHPRLLRFILDAQARGLRLVLVITGKGRDRDDGGPIPVRRGALRHQVPGWLNAPPLSSAVLDLRTAHARHGGEGAYYVYLRRNR